MQSSLIQLPGDLPTFEAALAALDHVPTILYSGLEHAAFKTSEYRESECPKRKLEAGLAATILRFQAMEYFRREGLDTVYPDGCRWSLRNLPFLGIGFYYKQVHVRVLKGPNGNLPGCGRSHQKKKYFDQLQSNYLIGNEPMRTKYNLIVLWDFDSAYGLAKLWLALPAKGASRAEHVRSFWIEAIPHPAEGTLATPLPPPSSSLDGMDRLIQPKTDSADVADEGTNVR
jgi:hypothetical protein